MKVKNCRLSVAVAGMMSIASCSGRVRLKGVGLTLLLLRWLGVSVAQVDGGKNGRLTTRVRPLRVYKQIDGHWSLWSPGRSNPGVWVERIHI